MTGSASLCMADAITGESSVRQPLLPNGTTVRSSIFPFPELAMQLIGHM
jgi:hypothetical protein